jgi:hypothetical protein
MSWSVTIAFWYIMILFIMSFSFRLGKETISPSGLAMDIIAFIALWIIHQGLLDK